MTPEDSRALAANIAFCETVGIIPGYLTRDAFDGWDDSLEKSPATPPGYVFGPAWSTLSLLMGVARYLVAEEDASTGLFDLQLGLNATWTFVFFGERSISGGVAVVAALWISIFSTF